MNIVIAGQFPSGVVDKFQTGLSDHKITVVTSQDEYNDLTTGDLIIQRSIQSPSKIFQSHNGLKALIKWGAGYDSIDVQAAGEQGVQVANTPGVNAYAVAELTVGLMIACARNVVRQNNLTHNGVWDRKQYADRMTTLSHKTVGIIGGGNIGRRVAALVQTFGAETVYYDAFRLATEAEKRNHLTFLPLEELLATSDVVSIHVPLLDSTRHMIGKHELSLMKSTAIIVNTSRGGIIDDDALYEALAGGKLAAAGLDCVENENLTANPLASMENVILTPHIGGTSNDLADEMVPTIIGMVQNFAKTGKLDHIVNKEYLRVG